MCGRYYTGLLKQQIAERMRAKKVFTKPYALDYNVAPATFQPIVRQELAPGRIVRFEMAGRELPRG